MKKLIILSLRALYICLLIFSSELVSAEITQRDVLANCQKLPMDSLDPRYASDFGVTTGISTPAYYDEEAQRWIVPCSSGQTCSLYTSPNGIFYIEDSSYTIVGKFKAEGWLAKSCQFPCDSPWYQVYIFYFTAPGEWISHAPPCEWVCDLNRILYDTNGQCHVALLSTQPGFARDDNGYYSFGMCPNYSIEHNYPSCGEFGPLPSPPDARVCAGDPVDAFSGVYFYNEEDIGYPYPSMVSIVRKYSSGISAVGPFGVGTSIDYNHRLVEITGFYFYASPDGGLYILRQDADGSYSNADYPFLRHVKFYLTPEKKAVFKGEDTFTFYQNGYLQKMSDSNGNWVEVTRDDSGNILGVSDIFGRSLQITNTEVVVNGTAYTVIESVKDALQREVGYAYNGEGQLVSVVRPDLAR